MGVYNRPESPFQRAMLYLMIRIHSTETAERHIIRFESVLNLNNYSWKLRPQVRVPRYYSALIPAFGTCQQNAILVSQSYTVGFHISDILRLEKVAKALSPNHIVLQFQTFTAYRMVRVIDFLSPRTRSMGLLIRLHERGMKSGSFSLLYDDMLTFHKAQQRGCLNRDMGWFFILVCV